MRAQPLATLDDTAVEQRVPASVTHYSVMPPPNICASSPSIATRIDPLPFAKSKKKKRTHYGPTMDPLTDPSRTHYGPIMGTFYGPDEPIKDPVWTHLGPIDGPLKDPVWTIMDPMDPLWTQ